ncbi:uncharacterized protein G2W53_032030 [Senna tora]|uniref:Uncharacterized protein n=1 Tax=Senna tora TaxID=362788 RepID=A0A834WBF2_9FABA|nr:uncharacterized protein G2W53_032030 [Senna tora]
MEGPGASAGVVLSTAGAGAVTGVVAGGAESGVGVSAGGGTAAPTPATMVMKPRKKTDLRSIMALSCAHTLGLTCAPPTTEFSWDGRRVLCVTISGSREGRCVWMEGNAEMVRGLYWSAYQTLL